MSTENTSKNNGINTLLVIVSVGAILFFMDKYLQGMSLNNTMAVLSNSNACGCNKSKNSDMDDVINQPYPEEMLVETPGIDPGVYEDWGTLNPTAPFFERGAYGYSGN